MNPLLQSVALIAILLPTFIVGACTSTTTAKDGSVTTTAVDGDKVANILGLAINAYALYSGHGSTKAAKADLSGIAQQAQAALGKTPAQANIAQGAATPAVGQAVQSALPAAPITQQTVNTLFAAAK